jgi:riboflavin kinase/FMN adenylyltransferase
MAVVTLGLDDETPAAVHGGIVAVGNFDGVHRGHASLLAEARRFAGPIMPVVPVTFDPHPLVLLDPKRYLPPLTTVAEKTRVLGDVGADHLVVLQTTPALLHLSPSDFFEKIIHGRLRPRGVVEGFNFRFGRDRAGSNETLRQLCSEVRIEFRVVPALEDGGRPVSSSRVREALLTGDVATATHLLGRPYRLIGIVGSGARRGRTIGFPTANLEQVETILPATGVYAVRATTSMGGFAGAANVGPNPTFGEDARKVEIHLLDFDGDLYRKEMSVDFVARLRDTKRFAHVDELIGQMRHDVAEARRILEK